jgi:DNA-binding beta-propeller fold protein YncE
MPNLTRRNALRTLGLGSVLAQMACHQDCRGFFTFFGVTFVYWLFGQSAGSIIEYLLKREIKDQGLEDRQIQAALAAEIVNAFLSSVEAGSSPSGSGGPPRSATSVSHACYVLDSLGDATVDGRVFALSADDSSSTVRGTVTLRVAIPGASPLTLTDIALSKDGNRLLVSQAGLPPEWIFIDAASLTIAGRVTPPAGVFPRQAIFSPDGKFAYTFSSDRRFDETAQRFTVHVLDATTRTVLNSLALPAGTSIDDIAITPDGALLFAVGNRLVHVIDTATLTYSGSNDIVTPSGPFVSGNARRLAMHPDGARVFTVISRFPSGATVPVVATIDTRTAQVVAEWPLKYPTGGTGPRLMLVGDGRTLAAGFQRGPELQIYDTTAGEPLPSIVFPSNFGFADAVSG